MKYQSIAIVLLGLFLGCENPSHLKTDSSNATAFNAHHTAIKELILKGKNAPKSYQEISWHTMQSSEIVSKRIGKRVLFIQHRFGEKNIYKGMIEREHIYFIGDGKPSLIIDFDAKRAFGEFVANEGIQKLFSNSIWNLASLHVNYQQSSQNSASKQVVKDFIYSIRRYSKEDQSYLEEAISKAYSPLSIANNVALFMTMRLFPELVEEMLFDEVTYNGTYK